MFITEIRIFIYYYNNDNHLIAGWQVKRRSKTQCHFVPTLLLLKKSHSMVHIFLLHETGAGSPLGLNRFSDKEK